MIKLIKLPPVGAGKMWRYKRRRERRKGIGPSGAGHEGLPGKSDWRNLIAAQEGVDINGCHFDMAGLRHKGIGTVGQGLGGIGFPAGAYHQNRG